MIKKCALWLRDSFIRNRSLNATRIVAGSFAAIILIGALLLAGGAGALGCSAAAQLSRRVAVLRALLGATGGGWSGRLPSA